VVDLSEGGAKLEDIPRLPAGTRGTLDVDGVGGSFQVTVCNEYGNALGVTFDNDGATKAAIKAALERLASRHAA
jgi:hypothetical protein